MNWIIFMSAIMLLTITILAIAQFAKPSKLQKICKYIAIEFTQIIMLKYRKDSQKDAELYFKK